MNRRQDLLDEVIHLYLNLKRTKLKQVGLYIGQPITLRIIKDNPGKSQVELTKLLRN